MGYKYEVQEWIVNGEDYKYRQAYYGNSMIKAIITMIKLKRSGCGCVKFEWR